MAELTIADSLRAAERFLATTIERSEFQLAETSISAQDKWEFRDGVLSHVSGGFFHVCGLLSRDTGQERLVLFQPQGALTGLALFRGGETVYVLLQARIEPGNSGIGQYGPTIQSTPGNYLRLHGGKQTPYLELFYSYSPGTRPLASSTQLDLGERYFQKTKIHAYVEVQELIETVESMIWVPLPVIAEASGRDNFLNTDLRSLLAVFDWDLYLHGESLLNAPSREDRFRAAWIAGNRFGASPWELARVTDLSGWSLSDAGIRDVSGSGLSVGMYRTSSATREVRSWSQPLMKSSSRGKVVLLTRGSGDDIEFLVSVRSEFGVAAGRSILPSYLIYPGEDRSDAMQESRGVIIARFVQSEEGGRFYRHESVYELVRVVGAYQTERCQYWVSYVTLKQLLKMGDTVSIQLRCIASVALEALNPATFGT